MAAVAEMFGTPLMPWQRYVADVGLELLPDGRPAYRRVGFTVPRQSGKTTLVLGWEVQRATGWAQRLRQAQTIAYSAQTGQDARHKLLDDQVPILERHQHLLGISKITRSNGSESVSWANGSRLALLASSEDSGHGKTIDLGVKDELFADTDLRRDQALNPAMATKPFGQELTASTMGTHESVALNAEVARGRAAVEADKDSGVAYFEWSASEEDDPESPDVWARCMPALGLTISVEVVQHAFDTLEIDEFKRAYLNVPTASDERVIPAASWSAVCSTDVEVGDGGVFAFDVNPQRSASGIVVAAEGRIEVVDYRPGTGWLPDRLAELHGRYGASFVFENRGPAGALVTELEARGVPLVPLEAVDLVRASGAFFDAVIEGAVKVRANPDLDRAVAAAARRPVGDAWAWGRKTSGADISLLVAASMAFAESKTPTQKVEVLVDWA